jgi:hypothetical protein
MFGGNDDEWERTHEREFALHTERRRQAFASSSSPTAPATTSATAAGSSGATAKRKRDDDGGQGDGRGGDDHDEDQEEAGWLSCRVVVTETVGHSGRQRKALREGLLHSRRPDEAGRYRVTLLHSRLVQEVRSEDVLLQGATLKHLNHDPTASAGERRRRERPARRRTTGGNSEDDLSSSDSDADGFQGFSLMHATGEFSHMCVRHGSR